MRRGEQVRPWTESDVRRARFMHEDDRSFAEIAEALGRTEDAVEAKLSAVERKLSPPGPRGIYHGPLAQLRAEAEQRREASHRRDLTATFCGDPPPGYSALDQHFALKDARQRAGGGIR